MSPIHPVKAPRRLAPRPKNINAEDSSVKKKLPQASFSVSSASGEMRNPYNSSMVSSVKKTIKNHSSVKKKNRKDTQKKRTRAKKAKEGGIRGFFSAKKQKGNRTKRQKRDASGDSPRPKTFGLPR